MNTQKMLTTTMKNDKKQQIIVRKCSLPSAEAIKIYQIMGYKTMPFYRKKYVVPEKQKSNLYAIDIEIIVIICTQVGLKGF